MTPRAGTAPALPDPAELLSADALGDPDDGPSGFSVSLTNFAGPFDVLLSLIARRQMDITEVSLAAVTDEFIAYIAQLRETARAAVAEGTDAGNDAPAAATARRVADAALDESSQFLVVASTLLDLKAARLLPAGTTDTEADEALLEARDLLFARLLQYKAFKDVSAMMSTRMAEEARRFPRQTSLDPRFAAVLPELVWTLSPEQFAALAQDVLTRTPEEKPDGVGLGHLHAPAVSVREQAGLIAARLQAAGRLSFAELVADADSTLVVVARFLALLEMYRDRAVTFEQDTPLGDLQVQWDPTAADELPVMSGESDFDQEPGEPGESEPVEEES
ncbi:condensin subunit ScpA [Micrococcus terreus]|uniref:Segregation and condensation protein A n=1 Tax=Micrococcus terreus TaxID=574650 RepID=A0A1I7ML54_9MICC|nr:condensin subunit ScpA [Micrococcus terreus]